MVITRTAINPSIMPLTRQMKTGAARKKTRNDRIELAAFALIRRRGYVTFRGRFQIRLHHRRHVARDEAVQIDRIFDLEDRDYFIEQRKNVGTQEEEGQPDDAERGCQEKADDPVGPDGHGVPLDA